MDLIKLHLDLDAKLKALEGESREWKTQFETLMGHQGDGRTAEEKNQLDKAVEHYSQAIEYGRSASKMGLNNYFHSYERVVIVCRKLKDYDREIEFIKLALTEPKLDYKDKAWFTDRLKKAEALKAKQK